MSLVNQLNVPTVDWTIKGVKVYSDGSNNLTLDASGNSSYNVVFSKYGVKKAVVGTNIDVCSNSVLNSCAMTIGQFDNSSNTNLNAYGAYYSFGESATQIAYGNSSSEPSNGRPGYIRYNTDEYAIEFWSTLSNTWAAISQPTPTFTSISPNYVPEDSSFNYTITGTNYTSGATIKFISVSGNIEYAPASGTSFISSTQLQARNTLQMSNDGGGVTGAGTLGYKIKITNSGGTTVTTDNAVLTYNQGPLWITAANTNLGTGVSGETYTYATSPFTDLSAVDTGSTLHYPIKYFLDPSGSTITGATSVVLDPSGRLRGTMPFVTTLTNYTFNAYPLDASGALGPVRSFAFSVANPITLTRVSGATLPTPIYVNASNTVVGGPVAGGFTIYRFIVDTNQYTSTTYNVTINSTITNNVNFLCVGGGAGAASYNSCGGGGAGGFRTSFTTTQGTSGRGAAYESKITFTSGTTYTIVVGGGSRGVPGDGSSYLSSPTSVAQGLASSISGSGLTTITSYGGSPGCCNQAGATKPQDYVNQVATGSQPSAGCGGGSRGETSNSTDVGGTGTTAQGYDGGSNSFYSGNYPGGGGGGAGSAGQSATTNQAAGNGGNGLESAITGTSQYYAGGGGGSTQGSGASDPGGGGTAPAGFGGSGVGGNGRGANGTILSGISATSNTGSGGGAGCNAGTGPSAAKGGDGSAGIIVIRFPSYG